MLTGVLCPWHRDQSGMGYRTVRWQLRRRRAALSLEAQPCALWGLLLLLLSVFATCGYFVAMPATGWRPRSASTAPRCRESKAAALVLPLGLGSSAAAERAYEAFASEYPDVAKRGDFVGLPCDRAAIMDRFNNLEGLVGPEAAAEIAERDTRLLLFNGAYVSNAWRLIKEKEEPGGITAISVVLKNPGLLTCEGYGLGSETMESLDRSASIVDAVRPLGPNAFFILATTGFIFALVSIRIVGKAVMPALQPALDALKGVIQ